MLKSLLSNLYFLVFLNGFLISSLFYSKMEAGSEEEIFQAIRVGVSRSKPSSGGPDSLFVRVTHACYELMTQRRDLFAGTFLPQMKSLFFQPLSIDLMTANGGCGSFSVVLARLLKGYGYPVRIAQMKVNGVFAAHNIVEVWNGRSWVVLDGMFDLSFRKPGRGLASFADVQHNWAYYSRQLPKGYNPKYRYEDVRYSNWNKMNGFSPAIKSALDFLIGKEKADNICLRSYILSPYHLAYLFFLALILVILPFTVMIWFRRTGFSLLFSFLRKRPTFKLIHPAGIFYKRPRLNVPADKSMMQPHGL